MQIHVEETQPLRIFCVCNILGACPGDFSKELCGLMGICEGLAVVMQFVRAAITDSTASKL